MAKKKTLNRYQQRSLRMQRIIFGIVSVIVILSWVISMIAK